MEPLRSRGLSESPKAAATDLRAATAAGYRFTKRQMPEVDVQFSVSPRDEDDELANENPMIEPDPNADLNDEEEE